MLQRTASMACGKQLPSGGARARSAAFVPLVCVSPPQTDTSGVKVPCFSCRALLLAARSSACVAHAQQVADIYQSASLRTR